jgi:hypothetical protein
LGPVATLVGGTELGHSLVERRRVDAERVHRPARLDEPFGDHAPRLGEQIDGPFDVSLVGKHGLGGLDLDPEGTQGVSKYVVDLACDAVALVQGGRTVLLQVELLRLGKQSSGLFSLDTKASQGAAEDQAEEQDQWVTAHIPGGGAERQRDGRDHRHRGPGYRPGYSEAAVHPQPGGGHCAQKAERPTARCERSQPGRESGSPRR